MIKLSVVMLNVIKLSVFMLGVVAPKFNACYNKIRMFIDFGMVIVATF